MKSWLDEFAIELAIAMAILLLFGTSAYMNNDTRDAQAQADNAAAAPAEAYAMAQADQAAARAQHPSAAQPARRRHPSTSPESNE